MTFSRLWLASVLALGCSPAPPLPPAPPTTREVLVAPPVQAPTFGPNGETLLTEDQKRHDAIVAAKAAAFLAANNVQNFDPVFSGDGTRILFRSNRDGSWQAYVGSATEANGAPQRISGNLERVGSFTLGPFARFTADDRYVLLMTDKGADENFRLARAKPDGTELTFLTPENGMRFDLPRFARKAPDTLVYAAHDKKSTFFYLQNISGSPPREVHVEPITCRLLDVSSDGTRALFLRVDEKLFELGLGTGRATQVSVGDDKDAAIQAAAYSADGRQIFASVEKANEAPVLVALKPKQADRVAFEVQRRHEERDLPHATIAAIRVAPVSGRVAVSVDAGNQNIVRLLDAETFALNSTATIPLGVAMIGDFSRDGKWLPVDQRSTDMFLVNAADGSSRRVRTVAESEALPVDTSISQVPAFDGLTIPVNVYLPKGVTGRIPVMVSVHGGTTLRSFRVGYSWFGRRWFNAQGFAVVEPNIRGSHGFGHEYEHADDLDKRGDALKDLQSVNAWIRAQPWCDPDRLVIDGGGSYGGYLALLALTHQPRDWAAGVRLSGIVRLPSFLQATPAGDRLTPIQEFGDPDKDAALLEKWSPTTALDNLVAPIFVYQATHDALIPKGDTDAMVSALRTRGVRVEYMVAEAGGHLFDRREDRAEYLTRLTRFLSEVLKLPAP